MGVRISFAAQLEGSLMRAFFISSTTCKQVSFSHCRYIFDEQSLSSDQLNKASPPQLSIVFPSLILAFFDELQTAIYNNGKIRLYFVKIE